MLRCAFSCCYSIRTKHILYTTLVRSQLSSIVESQPDKRYGYMLELRIQRQTTKFILRDYDSDYKTRLLKLDLLPLMYMLDFYDIIFFIKALKQPSDHFNILH